MFAGGVSDGACAQLIASAIASTHAHAHTASRIIPPSNYSAHHRIASSTEHAEAGTEQSTTPFPKGICFLSAITR
jgi:hypothetical protein